MAESVPMRRDYSMFDAELSGAVLNMHLLSRLMHWMKPYRVTFAVSGVLILFASTLQVLLPVIMSLVVIDHIMLSKPNIWYLIWAWSRQPNGLQTLPAFTLYGLRAYSTQHCRSAGRSPVMRIA